MSDVILSGDFTVYYTADNARKQIKWTGSPTGTRSANELYSAIQDLFDELTQLDDGIPMSAQTPTEYTIGAIDASDTVPWFIDDETIQRIYGGAIKTSLWTRITGVQAGIVKVSVSANAAIVYGDIGNTITATAGSSSTGVLVDMRGSGASTVLFIRPTDASATHDWTGTTNITCNGHATGAMTCTVTTGEALWANIYSLGSLTSDTGKNPTADLYVYRNGTKVQRLNSGTPAYHWWPTGQIDILMKVKEPGATPFTATTANASASMTGMSINAGLLRVGQPIFGSAIPAGTTIVSIDSISSITMSQNATGASTNVYVNTIDGGYVTVFAREYTSTYDYFTVDLNSGGRNPIPLATGGDLNNNTGTRMFTASAGSGTFSVGESIYTGASLATATARGVITAVSGTSPTQTVRYYLIGDLTELTATVTGAVSLATATAFSLAPTTSNATFNPANLTGMAVTFGAFTDDINNGAGSKLYGIRIDPGVNQYTLATMYEWTKYITRRGSLDTTNNNGINGERYIGAETILTYTSAGFGTYSPGTVVFQAATGAFGTVVAHDNANTVAQAGGFTKYVLLRNVRGSFNASVITDGTNTLTPTGVNTFTPIKPNPYGTFAGGKFFAAPGVMFLRSNLAAGDIQAYQLTSLDATTQVPPNIISVAITGLLVGDAAGVFATRATPGIVDKASYTMPTVAASGGTSINVTSGTRTAIATDEPQLGFLRVVKTISAGVTQEHRYRYASYSGTTFTLAPVTTGQGAALTVTAAQYWNSKTNAADTGGNLLRVTLGTAISTAQVAVGDMVFTAASGTPTTTLSNGSIVKIESTTVIWVRVFGTVVLGNWSGTGNVISFNVLATTYANTDKLYVPIIDSYIAAGTSVSNSLIYTSDINVLVRVRQARNILPFEQNTVVGSTGLTVSAIRSTDTIIT
jgi:hypothetical protein